MVRLGVEAALRARLQSTFCQAENEVRHTMAAAILTLVIELVPPL
jgi:hypothetical protein